jgi:hypothetical protein
MPTKPEVIAKGLFILRDLSKLVITRATPKRSKQGREQTK